MSYPHRQTIASDVTPGAVIYHERDHIMWFVLSVPKRWGERWTLANPDGVMTADIRSPKWRFL